MVSLDKPTRRRVWLKEIIFQKRDILALFEMMQKEGKSDFKSQKRLLEYILYQKEKNKRIRDYLGGESFIEEMNEHLDFLSLMEEEIMKIDVSDPKAKKEEKKGTKLEKLLKDVISICEKFLDKLEKEKEK